MTKQAYLTKIRRFRLKREAVRLKGGKCKNCGWSGNIAAFDFHHRDPRGKEFGISNMVTTNWEKYWKEVEKCDLLCSNCHSIHHSDYENEQFLKDVEEYGGRDLIISTIPWKNKIHITQKNMKICGHCKKDFDARGKQKFCSTNCRDMSYRKCERPSKKELIKLIKENSILSISRIYGVTDNSIRKWAKQYNVI